MIYVAFIFARGGSKGLPQKNIKEFHGQPLIAHTINQALATDLFDEVNVSTDCPEIAKIALKYGAKVPFLRPAELASDEAPEWGAWRHAVRETEKRLQSQKFSLVSLPCTSPLRTPYDINQTVKVYDCNNFDMVMCVTEASRNPWFNMVVKDTGGYIDIVNKLENPLHRRQDAPNVYDLTTVCNVINPEFVLTRNSHFEGKIGCHVVDRLSAFDIDTQLDFEVAELLFEKYRR